MKLMGSAVCSYAAKGGHLNCLKYSHENACSWDEYTCNNATENGYLECLVGKRKFRFPTLEHACMRTTNMRTRMDVQ